MLEEDNRLIKKCQLGNKAAFQSLISKYHPYVYKYLLRLTEDKGLAEDLTQDTFLKIIKGMDKYDLNGKARFSTYLMTIAKNCYVDELRKTSKVQANFKELDSLKGLLNERSAEEIVIEQFYAMDLERKLLHISEEQRIAIKLKYIEELTLKEIGQILNIEPKTVKSRIHNGIIKLRELFRERGDDNER